VRDTTLTGARSTGNVELPVSRHDYFDDALAAVFRGAWSGNNLDPANTLSLYCVEKRFPNPLGGYIYHRFNDSAVASMSLNITPGKEVMASVAYSGGQMDAVETIITGATYPDPGTRPLFASPEVSEITIAGVTNALCFTDLAMEFNSNVRGIECIGTLGFKEQVLGRFEAMIRGTAYFVSNDLLDYLLNQSTFAATVTIDDSVGNKYAFTFPRCKMTAGNAQASGTNQDVVSNISIQALYDTVTSRTCRVTRTQVA
jgi:Phage tail tube protein